MPGTEAEYQQITYEDQWGESENKLEELPPDICPYKKIRCSAWNPTEGCEAKFCVMKETE